MPVTRNVQYPSVAVAVIEVGVTDYTSAAAFALAGVPAGAYVVGGHINVVTAWDSATSAVLDVGDGVDADEYTTTPVDLKTAGITALDVTGYVYALGDTIDGVVTEVGAPTVGKAVVSLEYLVPDRGHEVSY